MSFFLCKEPENSSLATANLISGISVSAISQVPIAGSFTPVARTFERSSTGTIKLTAYKVNAGSGIAGSSLAELPQSGTVTTYVQVISQKVEVKGLVTSAGTLVITTDSFGKISYGRDSSSTLNLTGTVEQQSLRLENVSGALKFVPTTLNSSLRLKDSSVDLVISTNDAYRILANTTSTVQLVTTGESVRTRIWNRAGAVGLLKLTTVSTTEFKPSIYSATVLPFVNKRQGGTLGNGLFTTPLAAVPVAGSPLQLLDLVTTVTFQGSVSSSGTLVFRPVGEFVRRITESGTLSGDALASQAISSQDTQYRPSEYASVRQFQSSGNIVIVALGTAVNYVEESSGNLLLSTVSNTETKLNVNSDDQLLLSTNWVYERKIHPTSTGDLVVTNVGQNSITESGVLAGAPLASLTLSGEYDNVVSKFASVRNITSSGNLNTAGSFQLPTQILLVLSSGQLVTTNVLVFRKTINQLSSDLLELTSVVAWEKTINHLSDVQLVTTNYGVSHLTDVGSIAGSAIAGLPLGGNSGVIEYINDGQTRTNQTRTVVSTGTLNLAAGATGQGSLNLILSSGDLVLSSELLTDSLRNGDSSVDLKLTSSLVTRSIRTEISSGSFTLVNTDVYREIVQITSVGQLVYNGSTTQKFNQTALSSGELTLTKSYVTNSTRNEQSTSTLKFATKGDNYFGNASGLAGSAISSLPLAGGSPVEVFLGNGQTNYSQIQHVESSGSLLISSESSSSAQKYLVSSSGQISLSASLVTSGLRNEDTTGQLQLTSSLVTRSIRTENSIGYTTLINVDGYRDTLNIISTGQLALSSVSLYSDTYNRATSGQTVLTTVSEFNKTLDFLSTGTLHTYYITEKPNSINGISGAPLASTPLAGEVELEQRSTIRTLQNINSVGYLWLNGVDKPILSLIELSSGQLNLTSTTRTEFKTRNSSSVDLVLSTDSETSKAVNQNSDVANLLLLPQGELKFLDSTISGSPIASTPILGDITTRYTTKVSYTLNGVVYNESIITSSGLLNVNTYAESYKGYLRESSGSITLIPGQDLLSYSQPSRGYLTVSFPERVGLDKTGGISTETLAGTPIAAGSNNRYSQVNTIFNNLTLHETSSGSLKLFPYGENSIGSSSAIAGSSLAQLSIAGGFGYNRVQTVVTKPALDQISVGNLKLTTQSQFEQTLTAESTGTITFYGPDARLSGSIYGAASDSTIYLNTVSEYNFVLRPASDVTLVTTGNTDIRIIGNKSRGYLTITGAAGLVIPVEGNAGQIYLSGSSVAVFAKRVESSGTFLIVGTNAVYNIAKGEQSSGVVYVTGAAGRVDKVWGVNSTTTEVISSQDTPYTTIRNFESTGSLILFFKTEKYFENSFGTLVTTGSSTEAEFLSPQGDLQRFIDANLGGGGYNNPRAFSFWNKKPKPFVWDIESSGTIGTITGTGAAAKYLNFAKKEPVKSVIEVSSTPSRFILKTFGLDPRTTSNNSTGAVNVKGNTQVEFIRSMNAMSEMDANSIAINRIRQRILMEDEMLLNGSLTNLDPLQDELDSELF